jgi:hypothetical protein
MVKHVEQSKPLSEPTPGFRVVVVNTCQVGGCAEDRFVSCHLCGRRVCVDHAICVVLHGRYRWLCCVPDAVVNPGCGAFVAGPRYRMVKLLDWPRSVAGLPALES